MPLLARLQRAWGLLTGRGDADEDRPALQGEDPHYAHRAARDLARLLAARLPPSSESDGTPPPEKDVQEITQALGSLFRSQGDIDQAVSLRKALLGRPGLTPEARAAVLFELGLDYRQAGLLDRARQSLAEARQEGFDERRVTEELARLQADSGDFAFAARLYADLGNGPAEAFYLVRQAEEEAGAGRDGTARRLLRKAAELRAGAVEAWLSLAAMSLLGGDASGLAEAVESGLAGAAPPGRLILLEGLHTLLTGPRAPEIPAAAVAALAGTMRALLPRYDEDLAVLYYAGLFLRRSAEAGDDPPGAAAGKALRNNAAETDEADDGTAEGAAGESAGEAAERCFTKALVLEPEFWAARLALLETATRREPLSPLLRQQIDFFTSRVLQVKRFICPPCGLRRETVFSCCPRCGAWHTVAFRLHLH